MTHTAPVLRFVAQSNNSGVTYGYHHQQVESQVPQGDQYHPVENWRTPVEAARELRRMNGTRAIDMGFTRFFTWTQMYGEEIVVSMCQDAENQRPMYVRSYLGSSQKEEVEI